LLIFNVIGVKCGNQLLALMRIGMLIQWQRGLGLHLDINVSQADVTLVTRTRNFRKLHRSAGIRLLEFGHVTSAHFGRVKRCRIFQGYNIGGA